MVCFDFDGTITRRDSLLLIFLEAAGWKGLLINIFKESPSLALAAIGLRKKGKAKERLFGRFFRGWTEELFLRLCDHTAEKYRYIMRPKIVEKMKECIAMGETVLVITASGDLWVKAFLKEMPEVEVVGTKLEIYHGQLTGRFASPNCKGMEKVRRLLELYPDKKSYRLVAYGDSTGDTQLLDFADEGHLV